MRVVIFAGGTLRPGKAVEEAIAQADLYISADSGTLAAMRYGLTPAFIVGDFDSLDEPSLQQLQGQGSQVIRAEVEKDETDTELAIQTAIEHGATSIVLLGALGGTRFDHTMANVLLLAGSETVPIRIIDGPSLCWLLHGPGSSQISGAKGDLLSLLPLTGAAVGVHTEGLYYPLHGETLYFGRPRGVSNFFTGIQAVITLEKGKLLIIQTNAQELDS